MLIILIFAVFPQPVLPGCAGDIEHYMNAGVGLAVAKAIAKPIPKGFGKTAAAAIGIAAEALSLCKNMFKDDETKEFHTKSVKILTDTVDIVEAFDLKIEQNFLKIRNAILNINASAQLIHQSVNRYTYTMALLEYDRFKSALENLGHKYRTYMELKDDPYQKEVVEKVFKRTCENMDTSPTRILMQIKEILEDDQGIFMIGMRMMNYTDSSFVEYFNDIAKSKDMLIYSRLTYELLADRKISEETEQRLRDSVESTSEEIFEMLTDLNAMREREYFSNLTYLFSGYFPRHGRRGYDNYLNRHYKKFEMRDFEMHDKYVYSVEYEQEKKDVNGFEHIFDRNYVSVLKMSRDEELELWKQIIEEEINTINMGDSNQTFIWRLFLKEKLLDNILTHKETDVPEENMATELETEASGEYEKYKYGEYPVKKGKKFEKGNYTEMFPQFDSAFNEAYQTQGVQSVAQVSQGRLFEALNQIVKMRSKLIELEKDFFNNVTYEAEKNNISMSNATEMQQETQENIKSYLKSVIFDVINSTDLDERIKGGLIANVTRIVIDKRRKIRNRDDYKTALKEQVTGSVRILSKPKPEDFTSKISPLTNKIENILNMRRIYVVRTTIKQEKILDYKGTDKAILTNHVREIRKGISSIFAEYNFMKLACDVPNHRLIAVHYTRQPLEGKLKGFGNNCFVENNVVKENKYVDTVAEFLKDPANLQSTNSVFGIQDTFEFLKDSSGSVIACYLPLNYGEECKEPSIDDIKIEDFINSLSPFFGR